MSAKRFAIISNSAFSLINFRGPLIADIVARGHTVFALAPDFDDDTRERIKALGAEPVDIRMSRTGLNPFRDALDAWHLHGVLARLKLDTQLGFAIKPVIYGTLAGWLARVPDRYALIAGLGYAFGKNATSTIHHIARGLYRLSLAQTNKVFMQNPDDAADFLAMKIVDAGRIVPVNGTGVALEDWPVVPMVSKPVTFLLAARLLAEKGIFDYIAAARMIKAQYPQCRFLLLGSLDKNPNAIAAAQLEQWVNEGIVEWPGHVPVRPWLSLASVFVLPSYYREGVPRSIQEALAMGRPVITTDAPGCRETVVDGDNGFLIPPRDPQALAAAMRRFIEEPGLAQNMGMRSRALAEAKFDVRKINAVMIETMGL